MDAFYTENIVTEKYGYNMTINLYQDIDAPNPFDEFDTLGTLETFTSATEYRERIEQFDKERSIFVEGSTLRTEYVIYASRASIRTAYNVKRLTEKTLAKAFDCLMSERAIYENWLNGGVTGWKSFFACRVKYEVSMCTFYNIDVSDMTIRQINRLFRQHDTSTLWPICGRFNATERAIRRLQRTAEYTYTDGLEYALALDSEISRIVNGEV